MEIHDPVRPLPLGASLTRRDRRQGHRLDPAFQSRFRAIMLAFSVMVMVMVGTFAKGILYLAMNPQAIPVSPLVPVALFATAGAIGIAVFYLSDLISHRYCGPAHRLARVLEAVQRGERPEPIRLRKNDELQELAAQINETLQQLGAMDGPSAPREPSSR
jgi:hypothetical protein